MQARAGSKKRATSAKPRIKSPTATRAARPAAKKPAPLDRLRAICLALPESSEKEAWGTPTFRVRGKMFGIYSEDHHGDGRVALWCKAPLGMQEMLVEADPEQFFVPPYVGPQGWVGVRLDRRGVDWDEVADIVRDGYRLAAPAKLAAALAVEEAPPTARPRRGSAR